MSARERKSATFPDLLRTLAIFAVIIGVFITLLPKRHHDAVKAVEYLGDLSIFAHAAGYSVLAPAPVPTGWSVTSFRGSSTRDGKTPSTLHMGLVTQQRHYAALEESNGDAAAFIALQTKSASADGSVVIDRQTWQRYVSKGVISLSRVASGFAVVVTGGATEPELETLVSSLRRVS